MKRPAAYAVIKRTPEGLLVTRLTKRGREVDEKGRFWACPNCFDLRRGGGIVMACGACSDGCGWVAEEGKT